MATRKQRRRREKEKRHDYEIVYLDDEGNEVEPDEPDVRTPAKRNASSKGSSKGSRASGFSGRRGRAPQPPSWKRVAKRGAIFAPLFIATVLLIGGKRMTLGGAIFQAVVLVALFVPFSYFLDSWMWRSYQKRLDRGAASKR